MSLQQVIFSFTTIWAMVDRAKELKMACERMEATSKGAR